MNLRELPDAASRFGVEGLEARFARKALGSEVTGLSLQRLAPGARVPFGHRHREQEETYVVLHGSGRIRLGDEVRELGTPASGPRPSAGRSRRAKSAAPAAASTPPTTVERT